MSGRQDVTIAVMGPTGTGKSTFVKLVTGDDKIGIGKSLNSETNEIRPASFFEDDGRAITLVDTPGFDDSRDGVRDIDILQRIGEFLRLEYQDGRKLSGLVYLQRITDTRVGGISRRNLKMFRKLCGTETLKNVVIMTTMWNQISEEVGAEREAEMASSIYRELLDAGARMMRFTNDVASAADIIDHILLHDPVTLQIQEELAAGKQLSETAAGTELNAEINKIIANYERDMQTLRKEMQVSRERDAQARREMEEERRELEAEILKWKTAVDRLNDGLAAVRAAAEHDRRNAEEEKQWQRREFMARLAEERQRQDAILQAHAAEARQSEERLRADLQVQIDSALGRALELQAEVNRYQKRGAEERHEAEDRELSQLEAKIQQLRLKDPQARILVVQLDGDTAIIPSEINPTCKPEAVNTDIKKRHRFRTYLKEKLAGRK
ncbi:hypothetical protein OBBRIDRAFT_756012 [Obba rivulosa]|uniref:G domain-containing protein n=1 Tax=Obba rivulosa TaxID=1052685 RepID=A0A8E2B248_9APHY|nr:hypothetical protein OBBRIDRAFT_756012 [Obba rivulosa]